MDSQTQEHLKELFDRMFLVVVANQDQPQKDSWTYEEVINLMSQAYLHGQNNVLALWTTEITKIKQEMSKPLDPDARDILLARSMGILEGILSVMKLNPATERKIINLLIDISKATGLSVGDEEDDHDTSPCLEANPATNGG